MGKTSFTSVGSVPVLLFVFLTGLSALLLVHIIDQVSGLATAAAAHEQVAAPADKTAAAGKAAPSAASAAESAAAASAAASAADASTKPTPAAGAKPVIAPSNQLLLPKDIKTLTILAALCGALGAVLHGLGSLVAFAGNGSFAGSWTLWYLAQPFRGAMLASGSYWLTQGNLLSVTPVSANSAIGMMGLTFLVGLFSDPAIEKLRELFLVLFRTADAPRKNKLDSRQPVVASARIDAAAPQLLKVQGERFDALDKVFVNGAEIVVTTRTAKTLEIALTAAQATPGQKLKIVIKPTAKDAEESVPFDFVVP